MKETFLEDESQALKLLNIFGIANFWFTFPTIIPIQEIGKNDNLLR